MRTKIFVVILCFLVLLVTLALTAPFATAANKSGMNRSECDKCCVIFSISNIKSNKGSIYITFYKEPSTFLKRGQESFSRAVIPAGTKIQNAEICDVEPGLYAVSVMQDLDNIGDMKMNFLGLPEYPYGFSNIMHVVLCAPGFKECSFNVQCDNELTVNVRMINPL